MDITIRSDLDRLAGTLTDAARRQLPFATAVALTATARDVERDVREDLLPGVLDRPRPFTLRAFRVAPASKSRPVATVLLKDDQRAAGYESLFGLQEAGGDRRPTVGRALVIPFAARRDVHGNLPRRALARLKGRKDVFVGKVGGVGGFWRRPSRSRGGPPTLLVAFEAVASYAPRLGFWARVAATVPAGFDRHIGPAIARALATARPR